MPQQKVARTAFNRGKISRLGLGRVDVERAELTAETQTNWMPRVLGSMMLRPGWKYLGSTLSDSQAFLVPFVKSTDDTAFLEFTNDSLRVWESDAPVERAAVSTTIRGGDFSADVTNFLKLTDISALSAAGTDVAVSPDGTIVAYVHNNGSSKHITTYSVSGGTTLTALTSPTGGSTTSNGLCADFSPDGLLLASGDDSAAGWDVWSISGTGASATFNHLTTDALNPGDAVNGIAFSPDGRFLALAHTTSPYVTIYEISWTGGSAVFTALSSPSSLPAGTGMSVAWSPDSRFMAVAHATTPFVTIYSVNDTTFTKLSDPANLPAGQGNDVAFSLDGNYMAVAHGASSPYMIVYSISGSTFTKMSNPGTVPTGGAASCCFSSDSQFLVIGHDVTPFMSIYRLVSGAWTKQSNPATLPDDDASGVVFTPNNAMLLTTAAVSPFTSNYQAYQWLDMDGSGASSTYASGTWTQSSTWTAGAAAGTGFNGFTLRVRVGADSLSRSGDRIRVTFKSTTASTFSIGACYIAPQAASGDNYDFARAPTQITFSGGSSGFSVTSTADVVSDEITYSLVDTEPQVISFYVTSAATNIASVTTEGICETYYKAGNDTTTVNATGYTNYSATKDIVGIAKVEVFETASGTSGLLLVGTNYNDARRTQAVSVLAADEAVVHGLRVIVSQGEIAFHVGSDFGAEDLITTRRLGVGTYSFAFTPNASIFYIDIHSNTEYTSVVGSVQIEAAGDLTLTTEYANGDLTLIRYAQSGDVIYLACQDHKQKKVLRFGAASWGIADYLPADGPFRNENTTFTTLTASALTGDITITASRDFFTEEHIGALFRITSVGQTVESDLTGANQFTSHIKVTNTGTARDITITRAGTWSATITLQRSISEPGTWVDVATFTSNGTATYNDDLDNQTIYYRIGIKTGNYTSGTATTTLSYESGGIDGIARVTAYTDRTSVSAIVLSPMGGTDAFETWAEGIWSDYRGWPSAVALYEGRLAWAGMDRIILSESDNYENFNDLVEGDSGPIIRSVGEGPVDNIHWLLPLQRLMAGAEGSELSIRSNSFDEPLTPDNFNMKAASTQGSAAIGAVRLDSNGIFVERSGTRVYQMLYNVDTYDYSSADLTRLVPDMCEAGIKKIVLQRHPDTRLHCILNDGTVAVLIFEPDENTVCWVDITTDGTVEDAVVLPQQELEDAVYYVVKRTINSVDKRYVEKWALESECIGGTLNKQADSFYEYSGASVTTITGLDHLEGESVVVWGGGADLGTYTVTSGQITGLSTAVTSAIIGLTYTAQYKSCKLAYAASPGNTALNARKRIAGLGIIAADMHYQGLKYGQDFDNLVSLHKVYRSKTQTADTVYSEFDDDLTALNSTWTTDARLCLQATAPRPCTLLAVTIAVETNG